MAIKKKLPNKVAAKKSATKGKVVKKDAKKEAPKAAVKKKIVANKASNKPVVKVKPATTKKVVAKPVIKKAISKIVVKATVKKVVAKVAPKKTSVKKVTVTKSVASKVVVAKKSTTKKEVSKPIAKTVVSKTALKTSPSTIAKKKVEVKKTAISVVPKKVEVIKPTTKNGVITKNKEVKKVSTPKAPTHNYIKYEMEFPMHASRHSIFNFVTDASALSAWFADNVNLINEEYVFTWDGTPQRAKVMSWKEPQLVRYHWIHEPEGTYFEFNIIEDELTSDLALIVTDFAEDASSVDAAKRLWQSQIADLHHVIGG